MINDYKISKTLNTKSLLPNLIYNIISIVCSVISCFIFILIMDKTPRREYLKCFLICLTCIFIFKKSVKRKRPYKKYHNINNNDIIPTNRFYSFPSSHVMSSVIISLLLSNYYKLPFFPILPMFVILSRVGLGVHYLSDCMFSLIFTTIINFIFYL